MKTIATFLFLLFLSVSKALLIPPAPPDKYVGQTAIGNLTLFLTGFFSEFDLRLNDSILCFDDNSSLILFQFLQTSYLMAEAIDEGNHDLFSKYLDDLNLQGDALSYNIDCLKQTQDLQNIFHTLDFPMPSGSFLHLLPMIYIEIHLPEFLNEFSPVYKDLSNQKYYQAGIEFADALIGIKATLANDHLKIIRFQEFLQALISNLGLGKSSDILSCLDKKTIANLDTATRQWVQSIVLDPTREDQKSTENFIIQVRDIYSSLPEDILACMKDVKDREKDISDTVVKRMMEESKESFDTLIHEEGYDVWLLVDYILNGLVTENSEDMGDVYGDFLKSVVSEMNSPTFSEDIVSN